MWIFGQETAVPVLYTDTTVTTTEQTGFFAALAAMWFIWLIVWVVAIVAQWKLFEKAGEPGWKSIIPFYSAYVLCQIAGRNGLWFLLFLVPVVQIFAYLIVAIDLAKHFGKSTTFGVVAVWLFSLVGLLILGFGDAKYVGTKHE